MRRGFGVLAVLCALAPAALAAQQAASAELAAAERRWNEALAIIEREYLQEMSRAEILERALGALLADLDPYSRYLDPVAWREFNQSVAAEFGGIGAIMEREPGTDLPRVVYLMLGGASHDAGLRPGDVIVSIDEQPLAGVAFKDAVPRLRGTPGSRVVVSVRRGTGAPRRYELARRLVKTPSVRGATRDAQGRSDYFVDRAARIGYVRVSGLAADSVSGVQSALDWLRENGGVRALVLDLRDNDGGLMQAAIDIADLFLAEGRILTSRSRSEVHGYDAKAGGLTDVPMAVLVNGVTASSAEFLAAALTDRGRAICVGERTYGKARIQSKFDLDGDAAGMLVTTAVFERPSGGTVDRHDAPESAPAGIAPGAGLEVKLDEAEYDAWREHAAMLDGAVLLDADTAAPADRVLARALEALAAMEPASGAPLEGSPASPSAPPVPQR